MADSVFLPDGFPTGQAGAFLASFLPLGSLVLLEGPTGIGKTEFVRGFSRAVGVDESVTSPTFVTLQEYESKTGKLFHGDMDRLPVGGGDDFLEALLDSREKSWSLVEWGEKLSRSIWPLFVHVFSIRFSWEGEEARFLAVSCVGGDGRTGDGEAMVSLFIKSLHSELGPGSEGRGDHWNH
ncbi:MAG: tRNA (adenosine(37)-N6)-threonylcarbamoyltransferase complex ATPase subunit type 1 TsaE [Leptospirales bacterium]